MVSSLQSNHGRGFSVNIVFGSPICNAKIVSPLWKQAVYITHMLTFLTKMKQRTLRSKNNGHLGNGMDTTRLVISTRGSRENNIGSAYINWLSDFITNHSMAVKEGGTITATPISEQFYTSNIHAHIQVNHNEPHFI
ncbi:predicted protein [Lichtheimia corymbifera JMRC:FSU:9682]|uniref:Uncharacterized protein n=1 Tax=Lichtheimia corymbifera JMRC:FSU:9682 TaxID=1263082 RepID=A0A068RM85_9FUNG|nr:predicted protein [Lichtheimia corymbifera JMRC:FSU:9682]